VNGVIYNYSIEEISITFLPLHLGAPYHKYVAALPCEILMFNGRTFTTYLQVIE